MPVLSPDITNDIAQSYQQALDESVHFSFKTINSNIEKGGLRLQTEQALDLPYVSARTLLADGIYLPTDYQANAGKTASLFKVVKAAALNEKPEEAEPQTLAEIEFVKTLLPELKNTALVAGAQHIDVRMRQLLIPTENNQYLSLSPLTAAGLCHVINQQVDSVKVEVDELGKASRLKKLKTAVFGIGGANPQNVGSLVRAMQRPIVVDAPRTEKNRQYALSIFYKGFKYEINPSYLSLKFYQYLLNIQIQATERAVELGQFDDQMKAPKSNMRHRATEDIYLKEFITEVLQQGAEKFEALSIHRDAIPDLDEIPRTTFWSHPNVNPVAKGLIDRELQKMDDWKLIFAEDLSKQLMRYKHWANDDKTQEKAKMLSLDDNAKNFLIRKIIGLLP